MKGFCMIILGKELKDETIFLPDVGFFKSKIYIKQKGIF